MKKAGSDELEDVVAAHGNSVWRLIVRVLGEDGHDAADCFQQAFVELASRHRRVKDVREAGALLKRIAAARAIDVVRRRIRERARLRGIDEGIGEARRGLEPDVRARVGELLEDLRAALAELPEPQAAAFMLTRIEGMERDDAARALGVTVNHLGVLMHRAGAALRVRLESHSPVRE